MDYVIEMLNISKSFSGIKANDNITLTLKKGEIHALLGENGAGKSTLMSILFGMYKPDTGIIKVHGKEVKITNPNVATELKIGMVHQHFKLVDCFSVTENIILGSEPTKGIKIDLKNAEIEVAELSEKYHLNVNPKEKIENITVGMQQRVEILKMLYRKAEILIFDEPTAVLTPQEIEDLMKIIQSLVSEGKSVIIITHKLKEIKQIADRCSVLRKGKYIGTVDVKTTSIPEMANMMVGREVSFKVEKKETVRKELALEIKNLTIKNYQGVIVCNNINLKVYKNEILGLAGIEGNGQTDLIYAISGMNKKYKGDILFNNKSINHLSIKKRQQIGLGHIPEDRHKHGLILDFKLDENLVIHEFTEKKYSKNGILNKKAIEKNAEKLIQEFDIRSSLGSKTTTREMSGGNQQKAIIAREINLSPEVLLIVQPTRGLDVGAIEYIHSRIIQERDNGKAILLVSLELDEIMNLSDRIAVICNGEIIGEVNANQTNEKELGLMMSGTNKDGDLNE